ncbi:hypothetical protein AMATHDRAFT_70907 [Amanita thiersii Skay4041]|uniref:LYC1 C-terminal domain-containing protein n=1 Tax=Amanita thiersii Skay4041 TaxID=703135 RepID=A0A2A9N865_9AGAR|nr:hypothetical protein AMATHDRAFT_70907 [Amanita thiersii Skay4041]
MSEEDYLLRDVMAEKDEHARDGRLITWVLAPRNEPQTLKFLCSCETFKRDGLVCYFDNEGCQIMNAECYGIASVFTNPSERGKGYARHMMRLLHWVLAPAPSLASTFPQEWGAPPTRIAGYGNGLFSALWSDVGKGLYRSCGPTGGLDGWVVRQPISTTWDVQALEERLANYESQSKWSWLNETELARLWERDAQLLRGDMMALDTSKYPRERRVFFTFLPDHGVAFFQHKRTEHFWRQMLPIPTHWGIGVFDGESLFGERLGPVSVFATWCLEVGQYKRPTLLITRLRVKEVEELKCLLYHVWQFCRKHGVGHVEVWNLPEGLQRVATAIGGQTYERKIHLPSFKWYWKAENEVEWLFNERFCWC